MNISTGLVGLPNVGKSTLFNAITKSSVPAENYPFCTIEPHLAITYVPDSRLNNLQLIYNSEKIIPATCQFVDIAGLVKGAASGEGLGNQFLSHIKEVDLIIHVLRCFYDKNITYTRDCEIDPLGDFEIIKTELMLKDLESIEKRILKIQHLLKSAKNNLNEYNDLKDELSLLEELKIFINKQDQDAIISLLKSSRIYTIPLLSAKNFIVVANISEDELSDNQYLNNPLYKDVLNNFGQEKVIPLSAKFEYELSQMKDDEKVEICNLMGINSSMINDLIIKAYTYLDFITFFTCGKKEIHAWSIKKGTTIKKAAGEIHSDLERGFISADVFNARDLINYKSESKLKELGKVKTVGQDYIVEDGDIVLIRFNV